MADVGSEGAAPVSLREPFVGRIDALGTIAAAADSAAGGRGALVLVAGEAGIGKTRLVDEALRVRDDGTLVLWGTCAEGDGAPPFWPWSEALRSLVGTTAMPPEVVALLPGLAPAGATHPDAVTDEIRFRAFNLVADLLDGVGRRRRLAVVLDDLHWADASSLELLRTVARRAGTSHVLVVGTYRDTDVAATHRLSGLLAELARSGPRVTLGGLDVEEVGRLLAVSSAAVDTATARSIAARTGGNPFFVREVGRSPTGPDEEVPPAVRDVLLRRIEPLEPATRHVAEAAAVVGRVDVDLVARLLGGEVDPLGVLDAVDDLVHQRLLVHGTAGDAAFAHALVRETVLAALPARRAVELHARAAAAIEARSGPADVDAVAHHRVQSAALDPDLAVHWAAAAGRAARRQLAYEHATQWFERAAALAPPATRVQGELLVELAEAAGRTPSGQARGREAAAAAAVIARRLGDVDLLAGSAVAFAGPFLGILTSAFAEPEPVALADEALAAVPSAPSAVRVRLLARLAIGLGYTPEHRRALDAAHEALGAARLVGDDDALVEAFTAVTSTWNPADDVAAAVPILDEFEAISGRRRSREGLLNVAVNRCILALEGGDRPELERHIARVGTLLGELHLPVHGSYVRLYDAMLHRLDGRYAEAEAELLAAMVELGDQAEAFVPGGAQLMVVWHEQDRLGEIIDDARRLFGSDRFRGVPSARVVLAYFEAVAGDRSVAAEALPGLAASWADAQRDPNWLMGLAWLCRTAVALDDVGSGAILLELGRPHADRSVFTAAGTITLGVLGMWLAEVAILVGDLEGAAELLDLAEAHDRRLQDRGHLVELAYLRGRLAAAAGEPDAATLLGAAAAEAELLGMVRVARAARRHGAATPIAPAVPTGTAPAPAAGVFRREGDVWQVRFGALEARVHDSKGMTDLAVLLARPGVEVHVAELVGAATAMGGPPSAMHLLDEPAIAAYRSRLRELAADEDDAESSGDGERAARARAEREAIADQLAAGLGLGGASRTADDWVERARKAVRRRIDVALKRIEAAHPAGGRHLRRSVRTGAFCAYDPAEPVHWET